MDIKLLIHMNRYYLDKKHYIKGILNMNFCIIGLGSLGQNLAKTLSQNGMEVMVVDKNAQLIDAIRDDVTHAICTYITDADSLRAIGVDGMDTVIVALGKNLAESVFITTILKKELNIPKIFTYAINDTHKKSLELVGADHVIMPEKEVGIRLGNKLSKQ